MAIWAGAPQAAVVENAPLVPPSPPPGVSAAPQAAPRSNLMLWRNLGTAFDEADAMLMPFPSPSGKSMPDTVLDADLFGTGPVQPALP